MIPPSLPRNDLKNYRPVSGLNFISKVIERVVAYQVKEYLSHNNLNNIYQSAYKSGHSTETTLLKIKNDIHLSLAEGKPTALVLLDLSAAFDTIDHKQLLECLSSQFGFSELALKWFHSYISNRTQSVKINTSISQPKSLTCGVPQGSVLGPLLFIMYTSPLSKLISSYPNIHHHLYADDTQVYIKLTPVNASTVIPELQSCLTAIQKWMAGYKLKLNPDKTEFIVFGPKKKRDSLLKFFPIDILGNKISPTDKVRNLGVIFDSGFTFSAQVNSIRKSCFYYIRDFARIRRHLCKSTAITLANALVSSRLDYCNSLLSSISVKDLNRLQGIQNTICRIICRLPRFSSTNCARRSLHWLPVKQRIQFKNLLLTYKSLHTGLPSYLNSALVPFSSPFHSTRRSSPANLILSTMTCNSSHTSKSQLNYSFDYMAPRNWNSLPDNVRLAPSVPTFRKRLKTYLFWQAFSPP